MSSDFTKETGYPVPIVVVKEDHTFELDEDAIKSILLDPVIEDLPVVVISVVGAFRKGKSFLLNFLLRYLVNYNEENWLGKEDQELSGFSWHGGSDRVTTGILMWSKVFRIESSVGETVAVVLMDTQGAFDSSSTVKDCATIFALSTMTSSVQVYNLSQNIQEDDFQHLELFTEYGRLALEESLVKPFQSLLFLVRDWSYPYEHDYGLQGGSQLLSKRLELPKTLHVELQRVRSHIRSCFENLSCFLMPHPGLAVATNPKFKGSLNSITPEFKQYLLQLAPLLLAPENLKSKQINGSIISCFELVEYFRSYIKIFDGENLPEPKTMLQATAEANNLSALAKAREIYIESMDEVCGGTRSFISPKVLQDKHHKFVQLSLESFDSTRKMGGEEFSSQYRKKLEEELNGAYEKYVKSNASKNIFRNVRTPAMFFAFGSIFYIFYNLFDFIYLTSLSSLSFLMLLVSLIFLLTWSFVQFSGRYPEIAQSLELVADILWENFLRNLFGALLRQGAQQLGQDTVIQLAGKTKTD